MSQRSVLSWVFDPVRGRRKPAPPAGSVSDFVVRLVDSGHAEPAGSPDWLAAVTPPPPPPPRPEIDGRVALQATRTRQLEVENQRLKRMVGDLILEKEILQATVRRRMSDANPQIVSRAAR